MPLLPAEHLACGRMYQFFMLPVFAYTDYRTFLSDYVAEQKRKDRRFSYAVLARRVGFKSRTFLHKVINGEKRLSYKKSSKVGAAINLRRKEIAYFRTLVRLNEESSLDKKISCYEKLNALNKRNDALLIRKDQYDYFSTWYLAPLRELTVMTDFGNDYKKLGAMLSPPISAALARRGVTLLLRLNLIKKQGDGYIQTGASITTGDLVKSLAVARFQKQTIDLAAKALSRPLQEREIATLTFGTNEAGFRQIQAEIIAFRKKLIEIILSHQQLDRVYQLNFQLFPLTRCPVAEVTVP